MSQKALSRWLFAIIILVAVCMAAIYLVIVPSPHLGILGEAYAASPLRLPFVIFFCLTALPIALALVYAWLIARNIGLDNSFSKANASHLRAISILAAVDGVYYLIGNLVFSSSRGARRTSPICRSSSRSSLSSSRSPRRPYRIWSSRPRSCRNRAI